MDLSKHLSLKEVIKSNEATRLGIDNSPTPEHLENLKLIAVKIFEPIREYFNKPIGISSAYRNKALNNAIGGSKSSAHCRGAALDIDADIYGGLTNAEIFNYIKNNLEFTQLIWEFGTEEEAAWIHVSYEPKNLKKEILRAVKLHGKTVYINF